MSKFLNVAVHRLLKVWLVDMNARKICWTIERNLWNSLHHWSFHSKKVPSLVFYDNRDRDIDKSKKSEQYFLDKFEIFIHLFDEHFARHFESHWRETWRHTGRRTEPLISSKTHTLPPPPWLGVSCCEYIYVTSNESTTKHLPRTKSSWGLSLMNFSSFCVLCFSCKWHITGTQRRLSSLIV